MVLRRILSYSAFFRFRSVLAQSPQYFPLFDFGTKALPHITQRFESRGFITSANNALSCGRTAALNHLHITDTSCIVRTHSQALYKFRRSSYSIGYVSEHLPACAEAVSCG